MQNDPPNNRKESPSTLAQAVRAEMTRASVSQDDLAGLLGISQKSVSRRLTGEVEFRFSELEAIARRLGVPMSRFLADCQAKP